jgi:hypothetical protein
VEFIDETIVLKVEETVLLRVISVIEEHSALGSRSLPSVFKI